MRWLAAIVPLAFAACSYPEFAFTPSDTGAAIADSGVDTFTPIDSFVPPDTDIEDSTVADAIDAADTADTRDAADTADTRDSADTYVPRGCDAPHDFCANFDTVTSPTTGWSSSFGTGGAFTLDPSTSVSSPNSLRADIPISSATTSTMLVKTITILSSTTVIRADADVMLPAITYANPNAAIFFKVQRSSSGDGVGVMVTSSGVEVAAQTDASWRAFVVPGITAGKWFHLRMDVVIHPTAGSIKLWVDDMVTPKVNQTGLPTANVEDLPRQLLVGLFSYMGAATTFRAHFDDVSFDVP